MDNVKNVSPKINDGKTTPLDLAIEYGHEDIVEMIIISYPIRKWVASKSKNGSRKRAKMDFSSNSKNLS